MSFTQRVKHKVVLLMLMLSIQPVYAECCNTWKFHVAPYLWALNMEGTVQSGPVRAHVSESFGDIMRKFHGGGMLFLDAQHNKFGLFANLLYADLKSNDTRSLLTVKARNNFGVFAVGASYQVYQQYFNCCESQLSIEPYVGARYTLNNTRITIQDTSISNTNNQHWTDPILGARINYDFNRKWRAVAAGDIGGTNLTRDKSYNIQGLIGYKPSPCKDITVYAGYRLLYQVYHTGRDLHRFDWNMRLFGPMLGVSMGF